MGAPFEGMTEAEPHTVAGHSGGPMDIAGLWVEVGDTEGTGQTCPSYGNLLAVETSVTGRRQTKPCRSRGM